MKTSKPRILIAASIYPPDPGGPAIHAKAQFEGFNQAGYPTVVVALAHYRSQPRWIRHLSFLLALVKEAFASDVIYAHDAWGAGFPALVVAKMFRKPLVMRIGGDMPWERAADANQTSLSMNEWYSQGLQLKSRFFSRTRFVLRRVDALIVTSNLLADLYIHHYGVEPERVHAVLNPIPGKKQSDVTETEPTIVYASRLVAYKNLPTVLKVFSKIVIDNSYLKLVIMGDGPEAEKLKVLTLSLRIEQNVEFTGSVSQDEVLRRTQTCLFTIAPALTEFNPNYVLQGVACNKPFLVSQENGFPFTIEPDYIFDARNEDDLGKKIRGLLDPAGYKKAVAFVSTLSLDMNWADVIKENLRIIDSSVQS